jgi:hypothetical protein
VGEDGIEHAGAEMIQRIWDPLLAQSTGPVRDDGRKAARGEVEYWCRKHPKGADILAEFNSLSAA